MSSSYLLRIRIKPAEIVSILVTNRSKLLRFFSNFKLEKRMNSLKPTKPKLSKRLPLYNLEIVWRLVGPISIPFLM
ncbi:hypothetical protein J5N97_001481 [Dioscorea zingiberensis]|uniref:Uncharacterized protein n=1 Tax=Dioscorea zingiberensis TaxID=325984 RepID=A0A9D5BTZ3_9LILI|nr:hypothetical protein J5N97_001481 [Dioscorea zingiberensis]